MCCTRAPLNGAGSIALFERPPAAPTAGVWQQSAGKLLVVLCHSADSAPVQCIYLGMFFEVCKGPIQPLESSQKMIELWDTESAMHQQHACSNCHYSKLANILELAGASLSIVKVSCLSIGIHQAVQKLLKERGQTHACSRRADKSMPIQPLHLCLHPAPCNA